MIAEVLPAAVRRVRSAPSFQALVGPVVGRDSTYPQGWVFQGLGPDGESPYRDAEQTGRCSVVLVLRDTWASANHHNSLYFPMLRVLIFADPTRDASRNISARDADAKALSVFEVVDRLFHDPGNSVHEWSGVRIVSSTRAGGPTIMDSPKGDGMVRLNAQYNLMV